VAKEKLLFASPFPPMQTGVADLSFVLAESLREYFEVVLLVEDRTKHPRNGFEVIGYRNDAIDWNRFPHRFYHIGNNPWYHAYIYECCLANPGLVLLHDAILYYLFVGYYRDRPDFYSRVYDMEGPKGTAIIKRQLKEGRDLLQFSEPHQLPFNRELINSGNRFMTHSDYARDQVLARADHAVQVRKINQAVPILPSWNLSERLAARQRLAIPPDAVVLASFGFVAPTKLNHVICRAVNRLNAVREAKVRYVMVGAGSYVDELLNEYVRVTGYVSNSEYDDYLAACDLVLNLRYPSMGETSAAALRALGCGKPCVFTNDAWFSELPPEVAVRIEPDSPEVVEEVLYQFIEYFLQNREAFDEIGRNAAAYTAEHHDARAVARQIAEYVLAGRVVPL
jgi:glycosyltransferase involved in cell wall biosynthesis